MRHSTGPVDNTSVGPFYFFMKNDRFITLLQYALPKRLLTAVFGCLSNQEIPWLKSILIRMFIRMYQVDMSEALHTKPTQYKSFNEFFIRKLLPSARLLTPSNLVSPVDGYITEAGQIQNAQLFQAKGQSYTLAALLDEKTDMLKPYLGGCYATFYLAPKDYHRVHMPVDGKLIKMAYLPGKLFSVQPATVSEIPALFTKNERVAIYFETPIGKLIAVLVGATIVGRIATAWHGEFNRALSRQTFDYTDQNITLKQGEEMGYFKLGSTVILILEK